MKFASDKFEDHRELLISEGEEKYTEIPEFYNMNHVFFLEENSRWNYLIKRAKQNDIALLIDTALHTIEKNNKALKGALPDNYFSRLGLDVTKLASLLDTINEIDTTKDPKQDVVGKVYEYFLSKFALAEGKGKLLKFFLGIWILLIYVGMIPFSQFTIRLANFLSGRFL